MIRIIIKCFLNKIIEWKEKHQIRKEMKKKRKEAKFIYK